MVPTLLPKQMTISKGNYKYRQTVKHSCVTFNMLPILTEQKKDRKKVLYYGCACMTTIMSHPRLSIGIFISFIGKALVVKYALNSIVYCVQYWCNNKAFYFSVPLCTDMTFSLCTQLTVIQCYQFENIHFCNAF